MSERLYIGIDLGTYQSTSGRSQSFQGGTACGDSLSRSSTVTATGPCSADAACVAARIEREYLR